MSNRFLLTAVTAALLPGGAFAAGPSITQAPAPVYSAPAPSPDLVFTLRGGIASTPEYFGSDDYSIGPDFALSLNYVNLGFRSFGDPDPRAVRYGLAPRISFRYIDERSEDDFDELEGLDTVDRTFELGAGLGYNSYAFAAFADIRYGFGGHESVVGELGADVKVHPTDALTLRAGPRVLVGSEDYAATYFGISPEEAAGSQFDAYDAEGGLVSAGVEVGARYEFNDNWGLEGAVTYDRFVGDAEESPIVEEGDRDQYGIRIGVTRQITLDF